MRIGSYPKPKGQGGRGFVSFVLTWYFLFQRLDDVSAWSNNHRFGITSPVTPTNKVKRSQSINPFGGGLNYERMIGSSSFCLFSSKSSSMLMEEEEKDEKKVYFATCLPGMQDVLLKELMQQEGVFVDTSSGSSKKGVEFEATMEGILRVLIWVRTCHTIMELLCTTDYGIHTRQDLFYFIQDSIDWKDLLLLSSPTTNNKEQQQLGTLMVQAIINNPTRRQQQNNFYNDYQRDFDYYTKDEDNNDDLNHSHYTALTVKNALVDMVRDDIGERPNVDLENPDVPLCIVLHRNTGAATLYRTIHHPTSLHKRGYRNSSDERNNKIHAAAMKESMAAGLLYMAGWDLLLQDTRTHPTKKACLMDAMTGSATFCIEAALMAANIAPALIRIKSSSNKHHHQYPPILKWSQKNNNSNEDVLKLWHSLLVEAKNAMDVSFLKQQCIIKGNEMNPGAFQLAQQSIHNAGMSNYISLSRGNCIDWNVNIEYPDRTIVVANPPWGIRLNHNYNNNNNNNNNNSGGSDGDESSWLDLSTFLKTKCQGTEAWILNGNDKTTTRLLRMKRTRMIPLQTGNLSLRWIQYHIFDNKKQESVQEDEQQQQQQNDYSTKR